MVEIINISDNDDGIEVVPVTMAGATTITELPAIFKGDQGPQGLQGIQGPIGPIGPVGADGISGSPVRPVVTRKNFSKVLTSNSPRAWSVAGIYGPDDDPDGTTYYKFTANASGGDNFFTYGQSGVDLRKQNIRIRIMCDNWNGVSELSLTLCNYADPQPIPYASVSLLSLMQRENGKWIDLVIPRSHFTSVGSSNGLNNDVVGIHFAGVVGAAPVLKINSLALVSDYKSAAVSLVFDGTEKTICENAMYTIGQYDIAATVYVTPATIGTRGNLTAANVETLHDAGWDIAGSFQSDLTAMTPADRQAAIKSVSDYLRNNGYRGAEHFAYPAGVYNDATIKDVRKFFGTGRTLNGMMQPRNYINEMQINAMAVHNQIPYDEIIAAIDATIEQGGWLILRIPRVAFNDELSTELYIGTLESLIWDLMDREIDVLPVSQAMYAQRPPKDGVDGKSLQFVVITQSDYDALSDADKADMTKAYMVV